MFLSVAVVIPALHPPAGFPSFVQDLLDSGLEVVVVDDGSGPEYTHVFDAIGAKPGATVLTHAANLGKGRALKAGVKHCADVLDADGVVTADSDGQHTVADILAVASALAEDSPQSKSVVLGVRDFHLPHIPSKSRAGNRLTSRVVQVLFGRYFQDTQTGLRGFSSALFGTLLSVRGDRFEYEMNSLLRLVHERVGIREVPIDTVYHDIENSQTHFRPVRDSLRVYAVIFRQFFLFTVSSLLGSAADILLFTFVINVFFSGGSAATGVIVATLVARAGSAILNFTLNRRAVFDDRSSKRLGLMRYASLAIGLVLCSALGVSLLAPLAGGHVVLAKAAVDTVLFVASFLIQKRWVFADRPPRARRLTSSD